MNRLGFTLFFIISASFSFAQSAFKLASDSGDAANFTSDMRKGVTTGYYLGFTSLADEMRELRRSKDIPVTDGFFKSLYIDFHYANQEFNPKFLEENVGKFMGVSDLSDEPIENSLYGLTLGIKLGDNPNLVIRIPLSVSNFDAGNVEDSGMVSGIELFPNYRINEYVAWGVNIGHINSSSDFPIFDESMTSTSFEVMAESSEAYGMNWSGRLSLGRYFPSNEMNDDSFWLFKFGLALHYHLHKNFTMLPFLRYNLSIGDTLTDSDWLEFGSEFILMPNSPWNFSLGIAGIGGHDVIEHGMEFYLSTKANF